MNILDFVESKFPCKNKKQWAYLTQCYKEKPFEKWQDFVTCLSSYESNENKDMNVVKSSSWAICQEFLGNLTGDDLEYTKERSGIWNLDRQITTREVLLAVKMKYLSRLST